jgi:hypothetical protein
MQNLELRWKGTMNKIPAYMVIATLLGSVTMLIPLALLGSSNLIPDDNYLDTIPESGGETIERNNSLTDSEASAKQSTDSETCDPSSTESAKDESSLRVTNLTSNLSSIGLITVPSLIVALGVFVYFKKRTK